MKNRSWNGLTSFTLHVTAMALMLCDHLWATLFPQQMWLTAIGRLAFPIFAFMAVEGYFHTSDIRRYLMRIGIFATLSEIPFDLVYGSTVFYPFHQNVLWTFLIALLLIRFLESVKNGPHRQFYLPAAAAVCLFGYVVGSLLMVDYYGAGVLSVLVFYFFRGRSLRAFAGQLICLSYLNIVLLGGYYFTIPLFGHEIAVVQQGLAVLALIPIWLYRGAQGYHSKWFQYVCYAFYPVHFLVLYLLWNLLS